MLRNSYVAGNGLIPIRGLTVRRRVTTIRHTLRAVRNTPGMEYARLIASGHPVPDLGTPLSRRQVSPLIFLSLICRH